MNSSAATGVGSRSLERAVDGLAVAVLIVVAVVACLTFRDYGLGWDDYTHSQYGELLLAFYRSGFTDRRAFTFVNLYMYGGGFDMAAALLAKILPFDLFETRRLTGAMVGLVGLIATWRLGRRIGGPTGGLIALVLLATCPLYYGQMFINAKDAPFAAAMALLLWSLVRAFDEYPRPTPSTIILFGVATGLTVGSRVIGGIAAVYFATAVILLLALEARRESLIPAAQRVVRFLVWLLPGLVLAYLVMAIVWPWSVIEPLNPFRALGYFSHFFEKPWRELYAGALRVVDQMPRTYVPNLFAHQMPEVFLALSVTGTILAFMHSVRSNLSVQSRAALLLLATAATLPIAMTVVLKPAMYNGVRHFVFVTPALAALGGFAGARAFDFLHRRGRGWATAGVAVVIAALMLPVTGFARLHPYEYIQFNFVTGGIRAARSQYMLDYWGLSFKQASQGLLTWLAQRGEKPTGATWKVAVCGPHPPARVALGPQFALTWEPRGADFALMLGEFYCARLDAPVLVEVAREGVVLTRVYDIRGRTFESLFTYPPVQ